MRLVVCVFSVVAAAFFLSACSVVSAVSLFSVLCASSASLCCFSCCVLLGSPTVEKPIFAPLLTFQKVCTVFVFFSVFLPFFVVV